VLMFRFMKLVPPKGGTLTAAGTASRVAWNNRALPEYRVYAEHRRTVEQCSMFGFMKLVPPKGGTLTATDAPHFTHHVSQRGVTQRYSCNQRSCYAPSIALRLRRAETKHSRACALQTLRDRPGARHARQRMECGGLPPLCWWVTETFNFNFQSPVWLQVERCALRVERWLAC